MIEYRPQETGTDLGLFQLLFAKCQPPEEVQKTHQIIEHMLEYLSKYELSCLARVNRTFYGFINQSVFFNRVKSRPENLRKLSDLLAAYHNPHLSEEAVTILRNGIIAALRRGDDPTQITPDQNYFLIGAQGNSVLTAALVNRDELLINVVFDIFEPGHPLFSLRDMAFCGKNTPLSLALKTGRYDLAQRLIVEKNCDVDGLIGDSKYTSIHSLHLCAFLLGTFYGKDDEQEKKLVSIMKAILKRSQNKDLRLFWGQTPLDILQADISHQDFECYEDRRKFFEFHCGSLFTSEQVEMGNYIMNEIISKIAVSRRWIHYYQQDGEPDKGAKHQRDLEKAEQEYAQIEDKHHGLIKFAEALVELSEFEVQGHSIKDYQQLQQYQAEYKKLLADIHERLPEE